jgi:hypothetical protein
LSSAHTQFYHRLHVVWVTKYCDKDLRALMRNRIREIIRPNCKEMGVHIVRGCRRGTTYICSGRSRLNCSCPMSCGASRVARRAAFRWSIPNCVRVAGVGGFGPTGISRPPQAMSPTTLSCSIWNYIPPNDATGVRRQSLTVG